MSARTHPPDRHERSRFFDGPGPRTPEREQEIWALAELVEETDAFARRELAATPGVWKYRLPDSGRTLFLRHGTPDTAIFDEVFRKRLYDLPPSVRDALAVERAPTVVDVGANIGLFSLFVAEQISPREIVAFEPDPHNLELLRACMKVNGGGFAWQLVPACAGTQAGTVHFRTGLFASSRIAEVAWGNGDTSITPVVDVFEHLQDADLVKIDIEGGEWAVLADPRLAATSVKAMALEYHAHLSPPQAPPGRSAQQLLQRAGFHTEVLHERPDGQGMLWAWREREAPTTL